MSNFFFFNDTATTEIYTLSLHDALPILKRYVFALSLAAATALGCINVSDNNPSRSEEHTSELQSQSNLVCRLLLEKKKKYELDIRRLGRCTKTHATEVSHVALAL